MGIVVLGAENDDNGSKREFFVKEKSEPKKNQTKLEATKTPETRNYSSLKVNKSYHRGNIGRVCFKSTYFGGVCC